LTHYDAASDTYHCSYGPPVPALTIRVPEREILVRVDPQTRQVLGFSIPNFRAWHAAHADPDGSFDVELPPVWPLGPAHYSAAARRPGRRGGRRRASGWATLGDLLSTPQARRSMDGG